MRLSEGNFCYPILCEGSSDYKTGSFGAKCDVTEENGALRLDFAAELRSDDLRKCVRTGMAMYAFQMECKATSYRTCICTGKRRVQHTVPLASLRGEMTMRAYLVAAETILNFRAADWADEFAELEFHLPKGSALAFADIGRIAVEEEASGETAESVFHCFADASSGSGAARVHMENVGIGVGLREDSFEIWRRYAADEQGKPVLGTMVYLPALVCVLEMLRDDGVHEEYSDAPWLGVLRRVFASRGRNLDAELANRERSSFELAQDVMNDPIAPALSAFSWLMERDEEETEEDE